MRSVRTLAMVCALLTFIAAQGSAQQAIFVVRHAERADGGPGAGGMTAPAADPPLSAAGHERAKRLAAMLRVANIRHIFTTELIRTRQTAAPLAEQLKIAPVTVAARDTDALVAQVRRAEGNILIVGHSNTVPDVIKQLGVTDAVTIADSDFDNLFVVFRDAEGKATLVRLKF